MSEIKLTYLENYILRIIKRLYLQGTETIPLTVFKNSEAVIKELWPFSGIQQHNSIYASVSRLIRKGLVSGKFNGRKSITVSNVVDFHKKREDKLFVYFEVGKQEDLFSFFYRYELYTNGYYENKTIEDLAPLKAYIKGKTYKLIGNTLYVIPFTKISVYKIYKVDLYKEPATHLLLE